MKPNIDSSIRKYDQRKYARKKKEEKRIKDSDSIQNSETIIQNSEEIIQQSENSIQSIYSNTNSNSDSIANNDSNKKANTKKKNSNKEMLYKDLPTPLINTLEDFEKMRNSIKLLDYIINEFKYYICIFKDGDHYAIGGTKQELYQRLYEMKEKIYDEYLWKEKT